MPLNAAEVCGPFSEIELARLQQGSNLISFDLRRVGNCTSAATINLSLSQSKRVCEIKTVDSFQLAS